VDGISVDAVTVVVELQTPGQLSTQALPQFAAALVVFLILFTLAQHLGDDVEDQEVHEHADSPERGDQRKRLTKGGVSGNRHCQRRVPQHAGGRVRALDGALLASRVKAR
jgi:hypothetical protein